MLWKGSSVIFLHQSVVAKPALLLWAGLQTKWLGWAPLCLHQAWAPPWGLPCQCHFMPAAHQVQAALYYFLIFVDIPHFPPGNGIPEHQCFAGPFLFTLHNWWVSIQFSITGALAVHITFWSCSKTSSALVWFWSGLHTSLARSDSCLFNLGSSFCYFASSVMEHFIITRLSFSSACYFFPITKYECCHPTQVFLSHGY